MRRATTAASSWRARTSSSGTTPATNRSYLLGDQLGREASSMAGIVRPRAFCLAWSVLHKVGRSVRGRPDDSAMAQNFLACDREQAILLPPDLRDWLPKNHLAWFVIDAVEQVDLRAFYATYRADGHGRAA